MKNIVKIFTVASVVVLLLVGCRTAPIKNIDSAQFAVSGKHSTKDITKAIIRGGASLGWIMKSVENGHMIGTLLLREHVAIVDITYDDNSYSIKYKDSQNLDYDGETIHSNYNGWITNLNRNIQAQISAL